MINLSRRIDFSSVHMYRVPSWSEEKNIEIFGPCSNINGHGHNYQLEVIVRGKVNDQSGIVVNITDIDQIVGNTAIKELDGKFLNHENVYFKKHLPTTENIITYIWDMINDKFEESCHLHRLRLSENAFLYCEKGEGEMVNLTKKYHFSTAHRLHSELLTAKENIDIFGKCNNYYGHGHNYYLEVTVQGKPDSVTGMVINLNELDQIVEKEVLQKFDHKHLNLDTEEFKNINPTAENIAIVIWDLLKEKVPNLHKIGLWETEKNYFEYFGPSKEEIA